MARARQRRRTMMATLPPSCSARYPNDKGRRAADQNRGVMTNSRRRRIRASAAVAVAAAAAVLASSSSSSSSGGAATVEAFATPSSLERRTSRSNGRFRSPYELRKTPTPPHPRSPSSSSSSTSLNLLGSDGGILGVGTPEVAVILLVGYFVLGPSDLYKLVKEIGKFIQNFRTLGTEAAKQFEGTMENQLELTELRKAQSELNEAFNFRRSINTNDASDAFANTGFSENAATGAEWAGEAAGAAAGAGAAVANAEGEDGAAPAKKKRRLVRRKKKKAGEEIDVPSEESVVAAEYPDLDMLDAELTEEEKLRAERLERLSGESKESTDDAAVSNTPSEPDWFTASEEEIASEVLNSDKDPMLESFEKNRFQSQLSADDWNKQIMENEDELAPLSMVMKRLAILEEEKNAADKRLEEEYQRRMDNEDKYYLEKRNVLMDAITDIQEGVYGGKGEEKAAGGDGEKSEEKEGAKEAESANSAPKFTA